MFIIYKAYISHIALILRMLFTFEAFSLSLSDLGAKPDFKKLFVSVLQVIAKLRSPAISSGVSIFFKSFVPVCRIILSDFCSNDVGFHVLSFCTRILQVQRDIFQPLMSLTIESPSMKASGGFFLPVVSLSVWS